MAAPCWARVIMWEESFTNYMNSAKVAILNARGFFFLSKKLFILLYAAELDVYHTLDHYFDAGGRSRRFFKCDGIYCPQSGGWVCASEWVSESMSDSMSESMHEYVSESVQHKAIHLGTCKLRDPLRHVPNTHLKTERADRAKLLVFYFITLLLLSQCYDACLR